MSVQRERLILAIEEIAPPELMEDWDNTGIQLLTGKTEVDRILVCLDICEETIAEAVENRCDFMVSHHPMFFSGIKYINENTVEGRNIMTLIREGISVYSSHTAFDTASGGNNDYLAEQIGLEAVWAPEEEPILRVGKISSLASPDLKEFCALINEKIAGGKGLRYSGDLTREIRTVGICTGAGASLLEKAAALGCDVLLTGDVKYHDTQRAEALGIALIDGGHFETEIFFAENMSRQLRDALGDQAEILPAKSQKNTLKRFDSVL